MYVKPMININFPEKIGFPPMACSRSASGVDGQPPVTAKASGLPWKGVVISAMAFNLQKGSGSA